MKDSLKAGCGVYVPAGPEMQLDTTAYLEMCGKDVEICGDTKTIIQTKPSEKSYPAYPDAPEEGTFNLGKAVGNAAVAVVVVGGVAVVVCVTAGASAPVIIGAGTTAVLSGAGMVATDYMKGSVSGLDDYVNAVANAELMFFTNMAATKVIKVMGLGYGAGLAVREGSMAVLGGMQQLATDGELDYQELAMNLIINTMVDVGMDIFTGGIPGADYSEGGSGTIHDIKDRRFEEIISNNPPLKGDVIKIRNIYNELKKSEVGRETLEYLMNNDDVTVDFFYYAHPNEDGLLGRIIGRHIEIYVPSHLINTKVNVTKMLIHETTHASLDSLKNTRKEEVICFIREILHDNNGITSSEIKDVIKEVNSLYGDLPWR